MNKRTWNGPLRPGRHALIQKIASEIAHSYSLCDHFWKLSPRRFLNVPPEYGNGETRQEALAMIVGRCLSRKFQRKEVVDSLGIAGGTVGRYSLKYNNEISEESKLFARQVTGALVGKARKQFLGTDDAYQGNEN